MIRGRAPVNSCCGPLLLTAALRPRGEAGASAERRCILSRFPMKHTRSTRREPLLSALELLDDVVRRLSGGDRYVGLLTEQIVTETVAQARRRRERAVGIPPRGDQLVLEGFRS